MCSYAIELELGIRLDKVVMRTDLREPSFNVEVPLHNTVYLYWPIAHALDFEPNPLSSLVQGDGTGSPLDRDYSTGLILAFVYARIRKREYLVGRHRQERTVQRLLEVSVVCTDGMVDGYEICASRKGPFDHQFGEGRHYGG